MGTVTEMDAEAMFLNRHKVRIVSPKNWVPLTFEVDGRRVEESEFIEMCQSVGAWIPSVVQRLRYAEELAQSPILPCNPIPKT